ncbi:MAG: RluA family pseudouridine synthase [Proteobacteria bacterium]|nr:RluA family pseudouridine synthase [Pseudomonadota bacterium]MBU1584564.1 RluA family pseudouridine synthase [Pseudomonadota bacterium]MBU2455534.1 RluA family pseudouridine synthase [Pseudomonadota bacterium]MBU2627681.1 RluA family pseudouridine synthase [Pseudomonadota bacterium]
MKFTIDIHDDLKDIRLDSVISNFRKDCSRNKAAALVNTGDILVNNKRKKPGYRVRPGDVISGIIPDLYDDMTILPEKIPLDIAFEDDHILVINKEPGMVVHPAPGNLSGTLVNGLLFHDPKIVGAGDDRFRSGIVHRLDKDTSGLMVVAKTKQALEFLQKEFKQRRVQKKYLALVSGNLPDDTGEINLPIGRHPVKRKIMAINHEEGKPARTIWKVKKYYKNACLVEALLKTGRTHQIRVHFYAIDHPLIGDLVYQPRRYRKIKKKAAPRQMLHSFQLAFSHPYSGIKMFFKAELPQDFLLTLSLLESSGLVCRDKDVKNTSITS